MTKENNVLISVVSPVYQSENTIDDLVKQVSSVVSQITSDFEIVLVDDGSVDSSWKKIQENSQADNRIKGIKLSRNFGQHYAITAGLDAVKGEWIVVMDCDLQDPPKEIIKLYNKALEGYDYVFGQRVLRKDNLKRILLSRIFYKVLSYLIEQKLDPSIANFGIFSKKVITEVVNIKDAVRWFPSFINAVGFNGVSIPVEHFQRTKGKSSYNFYRLFKVAIDVLILNSDKPLILVLKLGFFISFFSFLFAVYILIKYYLGEIQLLGWTSLIIAISFMSGIIIFVLGIIGLYVSKVFNQVKYRPLYIIQSTSNL